MDKKQIVKARMKNNLSAAMEGMSFILSGLIIAVSFYNLDQYPVILELSQ